MLSLQIQLGLIPSISCILSFFVFFVTGGGTSLGFHRHIFELMFPRPALLPTNPTSDQQYKSQNRHHLDNACTYKLQPKFPSFFDNFFWRFWPTDRSWSWNKYVYRFASSWQKIKRLSAGQCVCTGSCVLKWAGEQNQTICLVSY